MLAVATALDVKDLDLRRASAAIKQARSDEPCEIHNGVGLSGLCAGLSRGTYVVVGDAGDYVGALNDGALLRVTGNAGRYVGDTMARGEIVVEQNAAFGAGLYASGGTLFVRGDAGDFSAAMNKGATILIGGDVGDHAATYHLAGDLIVVGDAGARFGNAMLNGHLYVGGQVKSLGGNARIQDLTPADVDKLRQVFQRFGLAVDPAGFRHVVAVSPNLSRG